MLGVSLGRGTSRAYAQAYTAPREDVARLPRGRGTSAASLARNSLWIHIDDAAVWSHGSPQVETLTLYADERLIDEAVTEIGSMVEVPDADRLLESGRS